MLDEGEHIAAHILLNMLGYLVNPIEAGTGSIPLRGGGVEVAGGGILDWYPTQILGLIFHPFIFYPNQYIGIWLNLTLLGNV